MKALIAFIVFCIVVVGLITWVGYSSPEKQPQEEHTSANSQQTSDNKKNPTPYVAFKIGFVKIGRFIKSYQGEIAAISTVIVAVFTIILGIGTVLLYRATEALVKGAEKTAQQQLSAYVSVKGLEDHSVVDNSFNVMGWSFASNWINSGQTPAREVEGAIAKAVLPLEGEIVFFQPPPTERIAASIGPDVTFSSGQIGITKQELDDFKQGRRRIFLYTQVTFLNIFGVRQNEEIATRLLVAREIPDKIDPTKALLSPFLFSVIGKYRIQRQ